MIIQRFLDSKLCRGLTGFADGIISLSLLRQGSRPMPGTRESWPAGTWETLHKHQRGYCVYCRRANLSRGGDSHIDHKAPVARGGGNELPNLQLLCHNCNRLKSDRTDQEFRYRLRGLLPQQEGAMPRRRIRWNTIRKAFASNTDAESYLRYRGGHFLTASQKVNFGSLVTAGVVAMTVFVPLQWALSPADSSGILLAGLAVGAIAGSAVRVRAWYTGRDQDVKEEA